ncbi:unnamed protein product [Didymodactylos carnosus]|nr:unnamed protein product [Didymodactylos carnosus]CAF4421217.1 unnamed protein product [Didymodactylos carnosus]
MIILVTNFNRTTPIHYQHIMAINSFVSQAFFSYVGAILVVILFESPFVVLEKRLFRNQKRHASDHGENKFLLNRGEEIESSYGSISELQNRSGSC